MNYCSLLAQIKNSSHNYNKQYQDPCSYLFLSNKGVTEFTPVHTFRMHLHQIQRSNASSVDQSFIM